MQLVRRACQLLKRVTIHGVFGDLGVMNAILVSRFFLSTSKHICNLLSVLVLGKLSLLRDYSNAIAQQHLL